jgi:hypothetical protein
VNRLLHITALLAGASALLCAALWATVWTPGEGVVPAGADIADLFGVPDTPTQKFQRALDHMGHEPPRAFDLNGNTVYFSVNFVDYSPIEALKRYQDEFVYGGINQKSYTSLKAASTREALEDMLTGGVVPTTVSKDYVAMGGGLAENRAQTADELARLGRDFAAGGLAKKFRAYRHIEAFREPGSRWTTVVATWSDESFDYRKMVAGSRVAGQRGDGDIPACPGCTRLQRFEDLDPSADHVDYTFIGPVGVQQTLAFYDRVLPARGWEHAPSSAVLERARRLNLPLPNASTRQYRRGEQTLTLVVYVAENGETAAHLSLAK